MSLEEEQHQSSLNALEQSETGKAKRKALYLKGQNNDETLLGDAGVPKESNRKFIVLHSSCTFYYFFFCLFVFYQIIFSQHKEIQHFSWLVKKDKLKL